MRCGWRHWSRPARRWRSGRDEPEKGPRARAHGGDARHRLLSRRAGHDLPGLAPRRAEFLTWRRGFSPAFKRTPGPRRPWCPGQTSPCVPAACRRSSRRRRPSDPRGRRRMRPRPRRSTAPISRSCSRSSCESPSTAWPGPRCSKASTRSVENAVTKRLTSSRPAARRSAPSTPASSASCSPARVAASRCTSTTRAAPSAITTRTWTATPKACAKASASTPAMSWATSGPPAMRPGNTPHLHFAIFRIAEPGRWWEGTPIDPYLVLR